MKIVKKLAEDLSTLDGTTEDPTDDNIDSEEGMSEARIDAIVQRFVEGDAQPGYDMPVVFKIKFKDPETKEDLVVNVEAPDASKKEWAFNRAVVHALGRNKAGLLIHRVKQLPFSVTDVSSTAKSSDVPYRPKVASESRQVNTTGILKQITSVPGLQRVTTWSMDSGVAALIRAEDGQAYEVQVRPASDTQHPTIRANYTAPTKRQAPPVRPASPLERPETPNLAGT